MSAPVAVFTYNRPDHTEKMLAYLNQNELVEQTDLFIFSDYAKKESAKEKVAEVRKVIERFCVNSKFRSTRVILAEVNKGLAKSIITGVTDIINEYGRIIVLEDDLLTSKYFLKYMNEALAYYQDNNKIWSISGYTFPMKSTIDLDAEVYFTYRCCSWGWGTWKDRWETVDWTVSDYQSFKFNIAKRKSFNRGGSDLTYMLMDQMNHKIDSWAIRWCYAQSKLNMLTVYPVHSYVKNDGADGSGTHTKIENQDAFSTSITTARENIVFTQPQINKQINNEFKKKYHLTWKSKLKRNMVMLIEEIKSKQRTEDGWK